MTQHKQKINVVCKNQDVEIFRQHLKSAGFKYQRFPAKETGKTNFKIHADTLGQIQPVIEKAYIDAAKQKNRTSNHASL